MPRDRGLDRLCEELNTTVFRGLFHGKKPLTGAPATRRVKTYAAQSGFAYSYWYEGRRPYSSRGESGTEFVFTAAGTGAEGIAVSVLLDNAAVRAWEQAHTRQLSSAELYGLAKMSLFQAFDERARPDLMKAPVQVRLADIEAIAETLGF